MEKQTEMHRYQIPIWNRYRRPAYIDFIPSKHSHLFLQLLQEKMNAYKLRVYDSTASCFLQIIKQTYKYTMAYELYVVSLNNVQEDDNLHRLVVELTESSLEIFLTEQDWDERLKENLG